MAPPLEGHRTGLEYLEAVTALLQRVRAAHPTKGLFEAADLQWWWRTPRPTDAMPQLFWFDESGRPEAAVIATDWGDGVGLDPMFMPGASPDWVAHVIDRGLAHACDLGFAEVELEVARDDDVQQQILTDRGFVRRKDGLVEAWMAADARPEVTVLHEQYRLTTRAASHARAHHLAKRGGPESEARLQQTSLYGADLDLAITHVDGEHAAHGLFWYDPTTSSGMVEPMRTEDDHQRRGLARHVLTKGLDLLAEVGAERIKICWHVDNPPARDLYLDVGFGPVKQTDIHGGPTDDRGAVAPVM